MNRSDIDTIVGDALREEARGIDADDDLLDPVRERLADPRPASTAAGRNWLIAAAVLVVVAVAGALTAVGFADDVRIPVSAGGDEDGSVDESSKISQEGPTVSVTASDLAPLTLATSQLAESDEGWLEHTITIRNTGATTMHVDDPREAEFLGGRQLLVATEGCGYGASADEPVEIACRLSYRPISLEPGAEATLSVTLWRDLPGMADIDTGPLLWRKPILYSTTPFTGPGENEHAVRGEILLAYDSLTSPADGDENEGPPAGQEIVGVWPETTTEEAQAAIARIDAGADPWRSEQQTVATRFFTDVLHWPDAIVTDGEPSEDGTFGAHLSVESPTLGTTASVTVRSLAGSRYWVVGGFNSPTPSPDAADDGASVSIGNGSDAVYYGGWIDGTAAEFTVRYGDLVIMQTDDAPPAEFTFDLGTVPRTAGMVMVLFRRDDGVALGGWATSLPPGAFAAG